jgi:hypothetical protein
MLLLHSRQIVIERVAGRSTALSVLELGVLEPAQQCVEGHLRRRASRVAQLPIQVRERVTRTLALRRGERTGKKQPRDLLLG